MKGLLILLTLGCLLERGNTAYIQRKNTEGNSPTKVQELRELLDYLKKSFQEEKRNSDDDGRISFEPAEGKKNDKQTNGNAGGQVPVNVFTSGSNTQGTNQNKKRTVEQNILMEKQQLSINRRTLSTEAAEFLRVHNEKRRIVSPKATNMREMVWDEGLETIARNYAEKCDFNHNKLRSTSVGYYVGENLYVSYGDISPEAAVTAWDNEKTDYDFANNVCDPNSKYGCGHYTQVTWAESEKVGCAKKYCSSVNDFTTKNLPGYLVVCNYGPGGNVNNRRPFSSGTTSCSNCPSGYTCVDRLCSKSSGGSTNPCETNPCQNGGTCSSESGQAVCKCTAGWTGTTCQSQETTTTNPCSTNPCKNGGSCSVDGDKAVCQCTSGWSGSTCETYNTQVTTSVTISCTFEIGFCLNNYADNYVDFNLYNSFTMNNVKITAAEGSAFAAVYAPYVQGTVYSYLMSGTLPVADLSVSFKYRVIGSAQLAFVYFTDETSYVSSVVQTSGSNGWQDWTGNIPSGSGGFFYFEAALTSYSLVVIDDVRYSYSN
nr:cysteine-rich secretory protein LCCL domain-containing 2 isoform X1 [Crassostrea gigas]